MFVMRHSKSPHASQPQRGPIAISSDLSLCHSLLPNAHGPIFCRKELREKVGVKVRLLDRFFIGLKSGHTDRFFVGSSSEKSSERFYIAAKVSAHEPTFTPIFGLGIWMYLSLMGQQIVSGAALES